MIKPIDLFNKYKDVYAEPFVIYPDKSDKEYSVTLTENDHSSKLRKLTVRNVPKDTILLPLHEYSNIELGNKLKNILKSEHGIFKCCDYLLITMVKGKLFLVFIEMKSEQLDSSNIKKQFKGASCFIEYCNAIIEHFYNMPSLKSLTVNPRYVLISKGTLNKRSIKPKTYGKHSSPDNFARLKVSISDKNSATVTFRPFI